MLFNSFEFIFLFLPASLAGFFLTAKWMGPKAAITTLLGASIFFYGYWNPQYLVLIGASLAINFGLGKRLHRLKAAGPRKWTMIFGVAFNLALLGYFKYANFFVANVQTLFDLSFPWETIILPIAISFFTFEQIAYLVDVHRGGIEDYPFSQYCLFVIFFPQLIAGPIVHHNEILPQFHKPETFRFSLNHFSIGLTIFVFGLFKKVMIADSLAEIGSPIFAAADSGTTLTFFGAWTGVLAYTFQIYFDFSAYSEMAIGLGRMFGLHLPLNFYSPYKAVSIIDFWRRWHMTLSRFLRDYLYIPLGGNRKGKVRRYVNLMLTMVLGGLWHGAGWGFVIWGTLHGIYLVLNHAWQVLAGAFKTFAGMPRWLARLVTFLAVVVAWVFFRAETLSGAGSFLSGMMGLNGVLIPKKEFFDSLPFLTQAFDFLGVTLSTPEFWPGKNNLLFLFISLLIVWLAPNLKQIMGIEAEPGKPPEKPGRIHWTPSTGWALLVSVLIIILSFGFYKPSEFIYFQF